MTKNELIVKQQLKIQDCKKALKDNKLFKDKLKGKFYNIGQPLNDNVLQFNKEQQKWCFEVYELIEQLRCLK